MKAVIYHSFRVLLRRVYEKGIFHITIFVFFIYSECSGSEEQKYRCF